MKNFLNLITCRAALIWKLFIKFDESLNKLLNSISVPFDDNNNECWKIVSLALSATIITWLIATRWRWCWRRRWWWWWRATAVVVATASMARYRLLWHPLPLMLLFIANSLLPGESSRVSQVYSTKLDATLHDVKRLESSQVLFIFRLPAAKTTFVVVIAGCPSSFVSLSYQWDTWLAR